MDTAVSNKVNNRTKKGEKKKKLKEIINNKENKFEKIEKLSININKKNENYIIGEIEIKEEDINKDIRIINSFEQYKREDKEWKENEEYDYKFESEKEIKEKCKIEINNKIIRFKYFYKFKKKGNI